MPVSWPQPYFIGRAFGGWGYIGGTIVRLWCIWLWVSTKGRSGDPDSDSPFKENIMQIFGDAGHSVCWEDKQQRVWLQPDNGKSLKEIEHFETGHLSDPSLTQKGWFEEESEPELLQSQHLSSQQLSEPYPVTGKKNFFKQSTLGKTFSAILHHN